LPPCAGGGSIGMGDGVLGYVFQSDHMSRSSIVSVSKPPIESLCRTVSPPSDRAETTISRKTSTAIALRTLSDSVDSLNDVNVKLMMANDPTYL
uniref:PDZ domain-containing protein n=1 Tax=Anisakis simplex TaxID=6269 RepID=A0A0M3J6A4_ANISI